MYDRYRLPPGTELKAPLLLQEDESTVVVARTGEVKVLSNLSLSITLSDDERSAP